MVPVLLLATAACSDPLEPVNWTAVPDTVTLYSASRTTYVNEGSVLDITSDPVSTYPLEAPGATGNWDFVVLEQGGSLALVPAVSFSSLTQSRSRIAVMGTSDFAGLDRAPGDTTAYTAQPVPLQEGAVYVLRSRRSSCGYTAGHRYAKVTPIDVDAARGTVQLVVIRNPFCDDRNLIPPGD